MSLKKSAFQKNKYSVLKNAITPELANFAFKYFLNKRKVAAFLFRHKKVKLLYPYKKGSHNYKMWKKYYSGASGLMGLKIKAKNKNSVIKFVNNLKLFK